MEVENLKAYLANIGMTLLDFCEIIDCNDKYMSRIIHGKKIAGHRLAKEVRQATAGVINLKTRGRKSNQKRNEAENNQQNSCAR